MFEKLAQIEKNYEELTAQISSPEIMSDMKTYASTMRQHRSLSRTLSSASGFIGKERNDRYSAAIFA